MRILWRTLPRLALPAATGLGLAYLVTGFLPGPEPALRPPEELRAHGQALAEESPVRAILERNVLHLESPPFAPPGRPLTPPVEPAAAAAAIAGPVPPESPQAVFAAPALAPSRSKTSSSLTGGPSVQGVAAAPLAADAPVGVEAFRLVGVVAGGATPVAMLQVDGIALALRPGEQSHGWTLLEVKPGQAVLRRGQEQRLLRLEAAQP